MSYIAPSITPSGTTFAQLRSRGASGVLKAIISAQAATAAPAAAPTFSATGAGQTIANPAAAITASANGGGRTLAKPSSQATVSVGSATTGSLPAGTYYVGYTFVTACGGETTLGSSVSNVFTQGSGNVPTVTLVNLPAGAVSMNVYLSNTNGSNSALVLYRRGITQATGATCSLDAGLWYGGAAFANGTAPPPVNTTVGGIPAGAYFAAVTQYHATGETTIGTSVLAGAVTLTANAAPSGAPTGAATTGTGTLAAAATGYYYQVTYVDSFGNETAGTENASVTALSATGEITVTFHDTSPDWVVTRNIYFTAPNGASGSETLYATGISPTATTYVASVPVPAGGRAVPTSGTSAAQVPSFTLPALATGAVGLRIYLSNTGGTNTALALYASGITSTTYYASIAPWNGTTFASGTAPPAANTTAGNMVAGTYYLKFTETNGIGETTASPESAQLTVASGNVPLVTFPALQPGNLARNLYVTAYNGASGAEVLYQTGITTTTVPLYLYSHSGTLAPTTAPTIATGTTYGGLVAAGAYLCTATETNGSGGETQAGPESLAFTIAAQPAPTGTPTVNVTGSGGSLAVATYYGRFTYVDSVSGETTGGNTFTFTQISYANPVITISDGGLPGWASGRNLYLGTSPGSLTLYASGITGTTYTMTAAFTGQLAAPSNAATATHTGSAGFLPAGAYYFSYTYVSATGGETTVGTSEVAPAVTITAGQVLTVAFNDSGLPAGAVGRNLYVTAAGGASGSETLYATSITTTTFACNSAAWFNGLAPTGAAGARPVPGTNSATVHLPATNTSTTNQAVVTFPALQAGNTARNLYLTGPGGASGSETLYASAISTTTYTLGQAATVVSATKPPPYNTTVNTAAMAPPAANMTGFTATNPAGLVSDQKLQSINSIFTGRFTQSVWAPLEKLIGEFLRGEPVPYQSVEAKLRDAHAPVAAIAEALAELGNLVDANPGHWTTVTNGIGVPRSGRAWSSTGE